MNPTKKEIITIGRLIGSKTSNGLFIFTESELIGFANSPSLNGNRKCDAKIAPTDELRALRLWHWKKVISFRKAQTKNEECALAGVYPMMYGRRARRAKQMADFHLASVQSLNDCFPRGDTAEADCAK